MSSGHERRREDLTRGIVGWSLQPARRGWIAVLFLLLIAAFAVVIFTYDENRSRIVSDEHSTCRIQARGLPAGHELAASMQDIHTLLTLRPTSRAQKLAAKNTPPAVLLVVADLNMHLAKYLADEGAQPQTRTC